MTPCRAAAALLVLVACTRATPPREESVTARPEPAAGEPVATEPVAVAPSQPVAAPAPSPVPPPVEITNVLPGRFALTSPQGFGLTPRATIERRDADGQWTALTALELGRGYGLRTSCAREPDPCVQLAPGAVLAPVPLTGMSCSSQCNRSCDKNAWLGGGTYRLAARSCDGGTVVVGPSFALPDDRHDEAQLLRWGIAQELESGTILRPDKLGPPAAGALLPERPRKDSERFLDATSLELLRTLLRAPTGYDDRSERRCKHDLQVGIRLRREPASTGRQREQFVELLLDFPCDRLWIAIVEPGMPPIKAVTTMKGARAGWLDVLHRALRDDPDVMALK